MLDTGWTGKDSPFHAGEQDIQNRLGVREKMETFGRKVIRPYLPDQHRALLKELPILVAGSVDDAGNPWATILAGEPGFLDSQDQSSLDIAAFPAAGDPAAVGFAPGAPVGFLAIQLATRRRNRLNGTVSSVGARTFSVSVDQAFGNCPQYIQARDFTFVDATPTSAPEDMAALDVEAVAMIERADTFFVATYADPETTGRSREVDVSHRGGRPGFVKVESGGVLTIPDFSGNLHFNTLGNILTNPKAGLIFTNFETGDVLQLTGEASIIWDGDRVDTFPGAERLWQVRITKAVRRRAALPIRWSAPNMSPNSEFHGVWEEADRRLEAKKLASTYRAYRVTKIVDESSVIRSFYLEPADDAGLPNYKPGQFLPIRLNIPGHDKPVERTYTLSSAPAQPYLRISVKREEKGSASTFLHDTMSVGDVIEAKGPAGTFFMDTAETRPAVLLSGGVGNTPMISMVQQAIAEGLRTRRTRPITMVHAAQTAARRAFYDVLQQISGASQDVRVYSVLSKPEPSLKPGTDYQGAGYIDGDFLREVLAFDDYDFYLCGPAGFMQALYDLLRSRNVPDHRIHAEAFGPAGLKRTASDAASAAPAVNVPETAAVTFADSGKTQEWSKGSGKTLLEFVEDAGFSPNFSCRSGSCGSCAVPLKAGNVAYPALPSADIPDGQVLICCSVPDGDVSLGL